MPEVLDIENRSFEFPWSEDDFLAHLRKRNTIGMVAEFGERVVGFMVYALHKDRIDLLNLAVDPRFRRESVGSQMVEKLFKKLKSHRRTRITTTIRESNLPGQLFLRATGFTATDVLREHYGDSGEDGYAFRFDLPVDVVTVGADAGGTRRDECGF